MLKRELKINLKSLIIWTLIVVAIFLVAFLVYPSIVSDSNGKTIQDMMEMFPKEMLKAFNMDIADISTAFGWFKTEGLTFLILIFGIYASLMGSNILLKEESDKTIEFLYSKPVSRNYILRSKIICGVINIFLLVFVSTLFIVLGLYVGNCLNLKVTILICITQIISMLVFFFLNLYVSTYFKKTKQTLGISLGIVFLAYFLSVFSTVSDKISFLKYISIYTLNDSRGIIETSNYNLINLVIGLSISIILIVLTYMRYNKKELCS